MPPDSPRFGAPSARQLFFPSVHLQNLRLRCQLRYLITYEINKKPSESNGHTTQLRQYLTHAPRENRSFSLACAQPYHQGSGSHGQLFRPCWSILKIVIFKEGKGGGGTIFVCNYLGGKVLIYHTFLKTPAPPPPGHNIRSAPNVRRSICCNRASRPSADQKCRHSPPSQKQPVFLPLPLKKEFFFLFLRMI